MGSASAYHLAKSGQKVLGIERYPMTGHPYGSSHGDERIIRKAYFESPNYVSLVLRAYDLFAELQQLSGHQLYVKTGGLDIGTRDSPMVRGAIETCVKHSLPHQVLAPEQLHDRFPGLKLPEGYVGVFQEDTGVVCPDKIMKAYHSAAKDLGADFKMGSAVTCVTPELYEGEQAFRIDLANGTSYMSKKIVVTVGAWMKDNALTWPAVLEGPADVQFALNQLVVERQVVCWLQPEAGKEELYHYGKCPVLLIHHRKKKNKKNNGEASYDENGMLVPGMVMTEDGEIICEGLEITNSKLVSQNGTGDFFYYALPMLGDLKAGIKLGSYNHLYESVSPDTMNREVGMEDIRILDEYIREYLPFIPIPGEKPDSGTGLPSGVAKADVCLFTNTPDGHFIVDAYNIDQTKPDKGKDTGAGTGSDENNVVVISACSGHGFKFCPSLGESVADLLGGRPRPDLDMFKAARFREPCGNKNA
jgi:sarcosine oxidase